MGFPAFFDQAPALTLHDGLSRLLGATEDGLMTYHYADAVRLAGHSCPTVASAWLMAIAAMKALYPDTVPERGGVAVQMTAAEAEGVTGVIGQVFTLLTGAAADNGFHGIAGKHVRQGLMSYGNGGNSACVEVTRLDNDETVRVEADLSSVAPHPDMQMLAGAVLRGMADDVQCQAFGAAWQDRVQRILLEHGEDPDVIKVTVL